jgi:hypothetical protein
MKKRPFYGEQPCARCKNGAYYEYEGAYMCGVHSRDKALRIKLDKDPDAANKRAAELKAHFDGCEREAEARGARPPAELVTLEKMAMMRSPALQPGVINVFPNYKHAGRDDGVGMRTLSPKFLGPVDHGQPGLEPALNLENFHQSNKVWPHEVGPDGAPTEAFFELQKALYADPEPHRHKPGAQGERNDPRRGAGKNRNIPYFSVWRDERGLHQLTYIQSRELYCTFYERLATQQPEFAALQTLLTNGYRLNLVGYDAYPVAKVDAEELDRCYLDPSRPFGHELVLFSLLVLERADFPWRRHARFLSAQNA